MWQPAPPRRDGSEERRRAGADARKRRAAPRRDVPGSAAAETLARAARYRAARYCAAGSSGLCSPGVTDADEIAALAARLRTLGVRRLGAGSAISEAMHGLVPGMMRAFLATGTLDGAAARPLDYGSLRGADGPPLTLRFSGRPRARA